MTADHEQQPAVPGWRPEKIVHEGLRLEHDADRGRYALWQGEEFIGFLGYSTDPQSGIVTLQHTIIDEAHGRHGYARALVTLVLDELRAHSAESSSNAATSRTIWTATPNIRTWSSNNRIRTTSAGEQPTPDPLGSKAWG